MWTERGFQWCPRPLHPLIHSPPRSGLDAVFNFSTFWLWIITYDHSSFWFKLELGLLCQKDLCNIWQQFSLIRWLRQSFSSLSSSFRSLATVWSSRPSAPRSPSDGFTTTCFSYRSSIPFQGFSSLRAGGCVRHCGDGPQHQLEHSLPPHSGATINT